MQKENKIQRFFINDSLLLVSFIVFVALLVINIVAKLFIGLYSLCISDLCFLICVIFLYIAFKSHNKNVQKGLLGAVLMWYFVDQLNFVVNNIIFDPTVFEVYSSFFGVGYIILSLIILVLITVFSVNHFIISGDHKSRRGNVNFELILGIILSIVSFVCIIFQVPVVYPSVADIIECVSWHIGTIALLFVVGSFEANFEAWKELRES